MYWAVVLAIILVYFLVKEYRLEKDYKRSTYYKDTQLPRRVVQGNVGKYGEYMIYKNLASLEQSGAKFLFNLYIPKNNGDTTEIDVLMICTHGIFVFESKNYSGWIFGSENQPKWCQSLPAGRRSHKEYFYNPIMQNHTHIKHLRTLLAQHVPVYSIIVFSDRCTFKEINLTSKDIPVIHRQDVYSTITSIISVNTSNELSDDAISAIYKLLYPYTKVAADVRMRHVDRIHSTLQRVPSSSCPKLPSESPYVSPEAELSRTVDSTDISVSCNPRNPLSPLTCPLCGGKLVLRVAERGPHCGNQFYGCSNFPKCKYIKNIEETQQEPS